MLRFAPLTLTTLLFAGFAFAADLAVDGKTLKVTGGDATVHNVPIAAAWPDTTADSPVKLVDAESGEEISANVRRGALVAVLPELKAGGERRFSVETRDAPETPRVNLEAHSGRAAVDVIVDGERFTAYHYAEEYRKPFLWPVNAEGGVTITRDWPMGEHDATRDHPHQKSAWTAYGDINGVDTWGEAGNKAGYQFSDEVTFGGGDAYGWIAADNTWQNNDREPVLTERREYRFYATPASGRLFDVTVTFTADHGDVTFGDTKEGGIMSVRMADVLRETGGSGTIRNSEGGVGARECWGKPADWCDYSGELEGYGVRGLTIMDHPENLRHPSHWHVRDYGLMGANCFGYSDFMGEGHNGDYVLKDGDSITFNYRVYVHSGDPDAANVAEQYAAYATAPKTEWVD
jgi:hypothetical protein